MRLSHTAVLFAENLNSPWQLGQDSHRPEVIMGHSVSPHISTHNNPDQLPHTHSHQPVMISKGCHPLLTTRNPISTCSAAATKRIVVAIFTLISLIATGKPVLATFN